MKMKVYLDDKRSPPAGWILVKWPDEAIELLKTKQVSTISLDHDLGNDSKGTGYDVLLWMEKQVFKGKMEPPEIIIHSANPPAKRKMEATVSHIKKLALKNHSA